MTHQDGPLTGIKVLDFTLAMAGPFATQKLGDMGADVIKVEPTGDGEWHRLRAAGNAWEKNHNSSFLAFNRNKRSLSIDLKAEASRAIVRDLISNADVLVQNFRPGVAARLGIDYASAAEINPDLVYCSISGYGESGPYAQRPGQDLLAQGMSGAMWNTGTVDDPPLPLAMFVGDATGAHMAVEGILAALLHRERGGSGQKVEVNLLNGVIDMQAQELSVYFTTGQARRRTRAPLAHTVIAAPYGVYRTRDSFIILSMGAPPQLAEALDVPELASMGDDDAGFRQRDEIHRLVSAALLGRTTAEWLAILEEHGFWAGPVYDYDDLVNDPQVAHNEMVREIEHPTEGTIRVTGLPIGFSRTPGTIRRHQPGVGEHSRQILLELGYPAPDIDRLAGDGVVQQLGGTDARVDR